MTRTHLQKASLVSLVVLLEIFQNTVSAAFPLLQLSVAL